MKRFIGTSAVLGIVALVTIVFGAAALKDERFVLEAGQGGLTEVALARLALERSENEEVRRFAQMMIDDHTAANAELMQIASSKNMTMPTEMNEKQRKTMEKLNGLSGAQFDREYMRQMVKDHEATVKLFEREADRGTDADLKAFAAKTLPNLREHLQMARSISGNTQNTNRNNNSNMTNSNTTNSNSRTNSNSNMNNMNMNSNRQNNSNMNNMNSNRSNNSNMNNSNMNNSNMNNMNSNRQNNSNMNRNSNSNSNSNRNTNNNTNRNTNSNSNVNSNVNN